jgi:pilus assembly protein CpaC
LGREWRRYWIGVCASILGWASLQGPVVAQGPSATPIDSNPQGVVQAQGQQPTAPPTGATPNTLPLPQPVAPFAPHQVRLPRLEGVPAPLGTTPHPTAAVQAEFGKFVREIKDPESTLDLISGQTRLLVLNVTPTRIQFADPHVATGCLLTPLQVSVVGKDVGTTVLTIWFTDPKDKTEKILTYLVRVLPDPEFRKRMENVYKALQDEINHTFPDSQICLSLVGDKLVASGQAKDIAEATQILRLLRANMPPMDTAQIPVEAVHASGRPEDLGPDGLPRRGLEDFLTAGGPMVINLIKIPGEQQVALRVTVAEVSRAAARSIGLNFSVSNKEGVTVVGNTTGNIATGGLNGFASFNFLDPNFQRGIGLGTGFANIPVALDNGQIRLAINALRNLNYARSLAEPNLVTMNGQTATFQAGGKFPVPVISSYNLTGLQGVYFQPFGVQLTFTPYITDHDRIRLNVAADVSNRDESVASTLIGGAAIPNLTTRNFQTTVELREGQTLAVAGLVQNTASGDGQRVPFFGDLPIIGRVFDYDRLSSGEQELVVLITPELVHPLEPCEVTPLPGSDLFEPTDLEFYLLGRLESRNPYDYRSTVMTDCARMKQNRHCEQTYISGPSGHSEPTVP